MSQSVSYTVYLSPKDGYGCHDGNEGGHGGLGGHGGHDRVDMVLDMVVAGGNKPPTKDMAK